MKPLPLSHAGRHLLDRRSFIRDGGTGLGALALVSLLHEQGLLASSSSGPDDRQPIRPRIDPDAPLAPRQPHFAPKANRVIMIFCSGAVSQMDTFDYKPELFRQDGKPLPGGDKEITFQGKHGNLTKPLWEFRPRGQCGKMISDLLPQIGDLADEICFIHSMTAKSNTHGPGENQMSTGFTLDGFPSIGSWATYALGSTCQDLPAFVAIPDPRGIPQMGPNNWSNAFLPAVFQGTSFNTERPIPHLAKPEQVTPATYTATRDFLQFLNQRHLAKHPGDTELSARIASMELAARMQLRAPEMTDFSREPESVLNAYGANDSNKIKAGFARNCILARRLVEKGVRFVQLFNGAYAMGEGVGNWDGHQNLRRFYSNHGPILDQPCAALLKDLRQRGLLKDTLVVWVTEFGRMPTFQQSSGSGRDHNPHGFTVWLSGAGAKKGFTYGSTDEFGYKAVDKVTTIYDLHATILHLMGLNHQRLSFYHNGIERRLTDVHGEVIRGILA